MKFMLIVNLNTQINAAIINKLTAFSVINIIKVMLLNTFTMSMYKTSLNNQKILLNIHFSLIYSY